MTNELQTRDNFWDGLESVNPQLAEHVNTVYHKFKNPPNPATSNEWRYASLLPVLEYVRIYTAMVIFKDGIFQMSVSEEEFPRYQRFMNGLREIKTFMLDPVTETRKTRDEDIVKGEIATLLEQFKRFY